MMVARSSRFMVACSKLAGPPALLHQSSAPLPELAEEGGDSGSAPATRTSSCPLRVRRPGRACAHHIGFVLQHTFIVDADALHLRRRLHSAFPLLNHVPCFVWQVLLLAWPEVNIITLRIGQC